MGNTVMGNEVKKYFVKENWVFNLESMDDKLCCIEYDVEDGKINFPFKVAETTINDYGDLEALRNECEELACVAKCGKVTSKQYSRIKAIVSWRVNVRYARCIGNGMSEKEAGFCFSDM